MRFVKAITGEFLHQVKDFDRQLTVYTALPRPFFKGAALLSHLLRLFLTHRTTQHIRAAEGIAGKLLGNLHDLFLVQDDAISWLQYRFQAFVLPLHVRIRYLFATVLTVDKVIHHPRLQRPRTEQRHQRDHIFEAVGLQTLDQILHTARFKLENGGGFRTLQHIEAFFIVERDRGDIQRPLAVLLAAGVDHLQRPVNDGERTQAEEVELHQPGIFNVVFIKLGNRMLARFVAVKRGKIGNFSWRDHHPTRMFTGVTGDPFELTRHVDQRFNLFVRLINFRQLRLGFKRFRQRHTRVRRHQLGNAVHKAVRMAQHTANVADNRFRRHGTEGNNLRYRIATVHVRDVFNHLVTLLHTEVNVEVGHGDTFRVKETFEQQVELQRIEVGNFQRIGDQRSGAGATSRPYRHAVILRPLDKFHNDQEVAREPHLVNYLQLNVQAFIIFRAAFRPLIRIGEQEFQALFQTLFGFLDQIIFGGHIPGRELRQEVLTKAHGHVTAFGDLHGVLQRFGNIGKELAHFLFAAHILLRRVVARALRIVEGKTVMDSHADFMGVEVTRLKEANIVGRHHR